MQPELINNFELANNVSYQHSSYYGSAVLTTSCQIKQLGRYGIRVL